MAGVGVGILGVTVFALPLRWVQRRCLRIGPVLLSYVALLLLGMFVVSIGTDCAGAGVSTLRAGVFTIGTVCSTTLRGGTSSTVAGVWADASLVVMLVSKLLSNNACT